jgi:CTP synthase (UTP-ammonia lyase)
MQMAVIEYARNILGYTDANSTEMNLQTSYPVISLMEEQKILSIKEEQCVLVRGNVLLKKQFSL